MSGYDGSELDDLADGAPGVARRRRTGGSVKTFYVRLSHRWVSRPAPGHWVPAVFVSDDPASRFDVEGDIGLYEVQCASRSMAGDIVTHWLAKGRPAIMNVREIGRQRP